VDESIKRYFKEISGHKLLGKEGEILLSKEIEKLEVLVWDTILSRHATKRFVLETLKNLGIRADTAASIREEDRDRIHLASVKEALDATHPVEDQESAAWREKIAQAERAALRARQKFVSANLRLVANLSRKFIGRGLPTEDLIQEGNLGLIKAVDRFDHKLGYRFSTYAAWWIRHSMDRALRNTADTVRKPVHIHDCSKSIYSAKVKLSSDLGREATDKEVADLLGMKIEKVRSVQRLMSASTISLDQPVDGTEGSSASLLEGLVDHSLSEDSVEEKLATHQGVQKMKELINNISPQHADILKKRFGLDDCEIMSLKAIGDSHNLSRERIRQIQILIMDRLSTRLSA
jgi:RNA polymerase primary sigma factor